MAARPRCYVASPLGFNDAGRTYYYETYLPALASVTRPFDPWSTLGPDDLIQAREDGTLRRLWLDVGERNLAEIQTSDVLVAWLDGQEADSGTAVEIGYGAGLGIRCYGLRTDLRQAGEEEMALNLQVETTIVASGGEIAKSLEQLVSLLTAFQENETIVA